MGKFCENCGRKLEEGEICDCTQSQNDQIQPNQMNDNQVQNNQMQSGFVQSGYSQSRRSELTGKPEMKWVIRGIAIFLEIFCFLPTMTISCGETTKKLGVIDMLVGISYEDRTIVEPQYICILAFLIPLIFLSRQGKKRDMKMQMIVYYAAVIVDLIFWILYRSDFIEKAGRIYCTANETIVYYLNFLLLLALLGVLAGVSLNYFQLYGQMVVQQQTGTGGSAALARFCPRCGKQIKPDAVFCDGCGTPLGDMQASREIPVQKMAPQKQGKPWKWTIGIVAGIAILAGGALVLSIFGGDDIEDLEPYMSKNLQEWKSIGLYGEDKHDLGVYYMDENTMVQFNEDKPGMLSIKPNSKYQFHGMAPGMTVDQAKELLKNSYDIVEEDESYIGVRHKDKDLLLTLLLSDGAVSEINVNTDVSMLDDNEDVYADDEEEAAEDIEETDEEEETADQKPLNTVEPAPSEFCGQWFDVVSQRCGMEIVCENDAYYDIRIDWGSSAWDNTHWEFWGEYDAEKDAIVYEDGIRYEETYPRDGGEVQRTEVYHDGTGYFYLKDGKLYWNDEKEHMGAECVFKAQEGSEYILPDSDSVRLTQADIAHLSLKELNYAKNEIYARHGRRFMSKELQDYFNSKSWYAGTVDAADFNEGVLSQIERENARMLSDAEFVLDPNGYQLDK